MLISLVVAMTLIPMLASLRGRAPLAYRDEPTNRCDRCRRAPRCAGISRFAVRSTNSSSRSRRARWSAHCGRVGVRPANISGPFSALDRAGASQVPY
jgi:hypothetical protein